MADSPTQANERALWVVELAYIAFQLTSSFWLKHVFKAKDVTIYASNGHNSAHTDVFSVPSEDVPSEERIPLDLDVSPNTPFAVWIKIDPIYIDAAVVQNADVSKANGSSWKCSYERSLYLLVRDRYFPQVD